MIITEQAIIDVFLFYYKEVFKSNYSVTKKDKVVIASFIKLLKVYYKETSSLGDIFFTTYFEFQFSYWRDKKTRFDNYYPISWFVGKKAFQRFTDKNSQISFKSVNSFAKIKTKSFKDVKRKDNRQNISKLIPYEERQKKHYLNTLEGLSYCIEFTTLYNPLSSVCKLCTNQESCKQLLSINYPQIYKIRIDE